MERFKVWIESHPKTSAALGVLLAFLIYYFFLRSPSSSAAASNAATPNLQAYYAADAADTASGNALQAAQLQAQTQLAGTTAATTVATTSADDQLSALLHSLEAETTLTSGQQNLQNLNLQTANTTSQQSTALASQVADAWDSIATNTFQALQGAGDESGAANFANTIAQTQQSLFNLIAATNVSNLGAITANAGQSTGANATAPA